MNWACLSNRLAFAGLFLTFSFAVGTAANGESPASAKTIFYVSAEGNDQWPGRRPAPSADRQDGPFSTLTAARDAIRRLKNANQIPGAVDVVILDGTYHLTEPLVLTPEDSGDEQHPVTWSAYPGHRPVLSGGRVVDGWKPYEGQIVTSHLPDVKVGTWNFRQIFFRGERQTRSCWPNPDPADPLYSGWAFIETDAATENSVPYTHRFSADQPPRTWSHPDQAEMNVFPWYCWVNDLIPVKTADAAAQSISLTRAPNFGFMPLMPGNRFRVENMLEELDQPGEWCLRTDTGTLYFWPPEDLQPGDVVVPVVDTLIELRGTAESPLQHITISGLTFSHTRTPFPDDLHENFHSPTVRGAGITLEHGDGCRVEGNRFVMLGGDGVRLQGANARNEIVGNEIGHIGGAGVVLAGLDKEGNAGDTPDFENQDSLRRNSVRFPKLVRNVISDNDIHHCGYFKKNCGGVHMYAVNSVDNVISHNRIHDMSDKGMVMQDGFGRYIVEYNDMQRLGREIADTGGIMVNRWFVLDDDPELSAGAVIRFNLIRDCIGCGAYAEARHPKGEGDRTAANGRLWTPYYTWGIYFDNSGMKNTVFGNIVVSTVLGGVALPVGNPKNNRVENNIFIGSSGNQIDLRLSGTNNRFSRNILYYSDPAAKLFAASPSAPASISECDHNVYFLAGEEPLTIRGIGTLGDWKKLGFDQHTLVADPLFVDIEHGDYRLRPESPAFSLGFQPIPVDKIGPRLLSLGGAAAVGLEEKTLPAPSSVFDQPAYAGITIRSREKGDAAWQRAIPEPWHKLGAIIATEPKLVDVPYQYEDAKTPEPEQENIYRNAYCITYDDKRCVSISIVSRHGYDTGVGFPDEKLWYRVSTDGGKTFDQDRPIIQRGDEYSPLHPIKYVHVGKNGFETSGGWINRLSNGRILFPFCFAPLDENGKQYNPVGGYTFSYCACLLGTWNEAGDDVIWDVSSDIPISGGLSSRGVNECAPIELKTPGHVLMVSRGGNSPNTGTQQACHWKTLSTDYGKTWSEYTRFTYDTGEEFYSPSSFANAIRSSKTGKGYWVGNISRTKPDGNSPRYPIVIGEIDEETLSLRKRTVTIVDDLKEGDPAGLQLSNFGLVEDPKTGHIVMTLNRTDYLEPLSEGEGVHTYVIEVK
ncbi:MAG: right-handed parallel beta-helix repeat-containing protein [Planctomycetaceae bacterium]